MDVVAVFGLAACYHE